MPGGRRVSFYGHVHPHRGRCRVTVVSFCGAYTEDWAMLVDRAYKLQEAAEGLEDAYSAGSTACVFLPPGSSLFGLHAPNTEDEDAKKRNECWCFALYGALQEFGCRWFAEWCKQMLKAVENGHTLVVVFKASQKGEGMDVEWPPRIACTAANRGLPGLGVSQRGEVAYMKKLGSKLGFTLEMEDIHEFRQRFLGELKAEQSVRAERGEAEQDELNLQVEQLELELQLKDLKVTEEKVWRYTHMSHVVFVAGKTVFSFC